MKIAVAGKGGVGKSSICAGLLLSLAEKGRRPFGVDADPNSTLGYAMGWPDELLSSLPPLSELRDVLAKRATGGTDNRAMFSLSPPVSDLIADHTLEHDGIRLLVMGTVNEGGSGCLCPENATLKATLRELVHEQSDVVVDMVAGVEHLGRGTAADMSALVVVTDPSGPALRSVDRIHRLARDLKLDPVVVVANRVRWPEEMERISEQVSPLPLIGAVSYHEGLQSEGVFSGSAGHAFSAQSRALVAALDDFVGG